MENVYKQVSARGVSVTEAFPCLSKIQSWDFTDFVFMQGPEAAPVSHCMDAGKAAGNCLPHFSGPLVETLPKDSKDRTPWNK